MSIPLDNDAVSEPTVDGVPIDRTGMRLPAHVNGWARPEFASVVRAFAWAFTRYRVGGGGLCVYVDGHPALDIWAGAASAGQSWTRDTAPMIFSASKGISATVIHRLVDSGLLSYDTPVARYWPEFGANGKSSITVRQILDHEAGLSRLTGIVHAFDEVTDHELMEQRLAAAPVGRYFGKPAYHALTFGWLVAGLARSVTGKDMRELYRTEIAEPLRVDGIHLGQPPQGSPTTVAATYPTLSRAVEKPIVGRMVRMVMGAINHIPGFWEAASTLYKPGMERILGDDGANPVLYDMQLPAGNGMATASALAKLYAALAGDGSVGGRRLLSPDATAALGRRRVDLRLDRTLIIPMGYHLGYHSILAPRFLGGFGHIGMGGSTGWADQKRRIAVGLTHNRLPTTVALDQTLFPMLWPLITKAARKARRHQASTVSQQDDTAANAFEVPMGLDVEFRRVAGSFEDKCEGVS